MRRLAVLTVLTVVVAACGGEQRTPEQTRNGLIAAAKENGIHLFREDGTLVRVIPGTKGLAEPKWSPNGELLAASNAYGVVTLRPDGSGLERVIEHAYSPSWSPDGKRLVVEVDTCADDEQCPPDLSNPHELYVVNADGTEPRRLTNDPGYDGDPYWSPDGDSIAFTGDDGLYLIRPDGSERTQLLPGDFPYTRGWSSDGTKLLIEDGGEDPALGIEVAVLTVETGERRNLSCAPGHDLLPTWSPDGEKIAFLATADCRRTGECTAHEPWEVWVMDADGKNARRITEGGFGPPSWAPKE
jgi:Tol biopolymer transport system component